MARSRDDYTSDGGPIDHSADQQLPPDPPPFPPLSPEEVARAQQLRAVQATGATLPEADKAELDTLAMKESEAAGHPAPQEVTGEPLSPFDLLVNDIVAALQHIADVIPAVHGLGNLVTRMRDRLGEIRSPPKP